MKTIGTTAKRNIIGGGMVCGLGNQLYRKEPLPQEKSLALMLKETK